jgi:hypothetical protein
MREGPQVWVFNGDGGRFPAAVFSSREQAEAWIRRRAVSGVLTAYPLDVGVFDWAVARGAFTPKRDEQTTPEFIQRFSSAHQKHIHYENGEPVSE